MMHHAQKVACLERAHRIFHIGSEVLDVHCWWRQDEAVREGKL